MKVSAAIVAFNHEPYIAQALDGALAQEVDFAYEIVVADDCSTDRTREILLDYQRRHPDKIRLLFQERNLGCTRNVARLLESCRGEYVALLDGDDYWTERRKLARQADYLDQHPTCAISYHQVREMSESGGPAPDAFSVPSGQKRVGAMQDLLADGIVPTGSTLFRREHLVPLPDWFEEAFPPDMVLKALAVDRGTFDFLDEAMSVYRLHAGGCWSQSDLEGRFLQQIETLQRLNLQFGLRYDRWTRRAVAKRYLELAVLAEAQGDLAQARRHLRRFLANVPWGRAVKPDQWRVIAKVCCPRSYGAARRLRGWLRGGAGGK
ncbi:MAG TPA: glycosyltransferase [Pirellulales bacterium]|jgi:glycosyltransferase involved in cell wall biosynthesis|nr:glycosyltransferase [Pirellulales bacterium]